MILFCLCSFGGCDEEVAPTPEWGPSELDGESGFRSSVWGSSANDVFVVGGSTEGQIHHYDGDSWRQMALPAQTPPLSWVFGFGPSDVYAVGQNGTFLHYDGSAWTSRDPGTARDLWGVWGSAPNEMWLVGGDVGSADPVLIEWDGSSATRVELDGIAPEEVQALFKVWGIGGRVLAVGQDGLILERVGGSWTVLASGGDDDEDLISLWGTSTDRIVAVGGRSQTRIAEIDATTATVSTVDTPGGANASFMCEDGTAVVGGSPGWIGYYDVAGDVVEVVYQTTSEIHGIWSDCAGTIYAVGGVPSNVVLPGVVAVYR